MPEQIRIRNLATGTKAQLRERATRHSRSAEAEAHGMTVVTRNTRHFEPLGGRVLNPWESDG